MPQLAAPEETLSEIDAALSRVGAGTVSAEVNAPQRRRRIREFLSPQSNGDQDTW